jgi:hypothetical protein
LFVLTSHKVQIKQTYEQLRHDKLDPMVTRRRNRSSQAPT